MSFIIDEFELLTSTEQDILRLKGLVLDLAVRGKLVEQNTNDEPATNMLARIEKKKINLIKNGGVRKEKVVPKILSKEIPFSLPNGWCWSRLRQLGLTQTGTTPPKSNPKYYGNFIPFLGPGDIFEGKVNYSNKGLSKSGLEKGRLIPINSILMVCIGGSIGKSILIDRDVSCNQQINSIHPLFNSPKLVLYFLKSKLFQSQLLQKSSGSATPIINKSKWDNLLVPLPPLAEQKRIVQKVNSLFQKIDALAQHTATAQTTRQRLRKALLQRLDNAPTNNALQQAWQNLSPQFETVFDSVEGIKALRKSILQLAVKGKLVPQNPRDEPATVLLARIKAEKERLVKEKVIRKGKDLPAISEEEVPFEVPEGWVWCRLQEAIDVRDGTHDSPKSYSGADSYPLVTSKDFNKDGTINLDKAKRISKEDYEKIVKRSHVEEFDILFSMIGGNIGNQVMVVGQTNFAIKNVALFKYYSLEHISPYYLKVFTEYIAQTLQHKAIGGAQPFVSLTYLRTSLFPLPPLAEQKRIVQKVSQMMAWCDKLEAQITKRTAVKERLLSKALAIH